MSLEIKIQSPREGVAVLTLGGEVDTYTAASLRKEMVDLLERGTVNLLIDLRGVEYLDSTGLGVLIGGLKRAREHSGDLRLVCDSPRILRILEITGLTRVFDMHPNEEEALAAIESRLSEEGAPEADGRMVSP